jgi:hypothetical protein
MIPRYLVLRERIESELADVERAAGKADLTRFGRYLDAASKADEAPE